MTLPSPEIDLARLAYVAKYKAESEAVSQIELQRLTGCSARQVSYLMNGKPICAGATLVLCAVLQIDISDMLPAKTRAQLQRIKSYYDQCLTPPVKRETEAVE